MLVFMSFIEFKAIEYQITVKRPTVIVVSKPKNITKNCKLKKH